MSDGGPFRSSSPVDRRRFLRGAATVTALGAASPLLARPASARAATLVYPWDRSGGTIGNYATTGSTGSHLIDAAAASMHCALGNPATAANPLRVLDSDFLQKVRTDKLAAGAPQYVYAGTRFQSHQTYYRLQVRFGTDRSVQLLWIKYVSTVTTIIGPAQTAVPRETHAAGVWCNIRVRTAGTNPTTLSGRVWRDGTPEPSTWDLVVTDSEPVLQQAGAVSCRSYLATGATNAPVRFERDGVSVTDTATGSRVASDTFTRTTANGWGTSELPLP